jgi:hypothetical protein
MSSKQMKVIMESWRRQVESHKTLNESQINEEELNEGMKELFMMAAVAFGSVIPTSADAGGVEGVGGIQSHGDEIMIMADKLIDTQKDNIKNPKLAKAMQTADKMGDWVKNYEGDVQRTTMYKEYAAEAGISESDALDAEIVLMSAADKIKKVGVQKAQQFIDKAEAAPDKPEKPESSVSNIGFEPGEGEAQMDDMSDMLKNR